MPKPRVLEKYDVDETRCILCGICVDACPYDALRCGPDFELSHDSRAEPLIDLLAVSSVDRDTEITYVRKERDWLERAQAQGRNLEGGRLLPMLPPGVAAGNGHAGNGHAPAALTSGNGHAGHAGHAGHSDGPGAHGH